MSTITNTNLQEPFWPAMQDASIDDYTIISKFESGEYVFHPQLYSDCLPADSYHPTRRTLFEYFVRKGFNS